MSSDVEENGGGGEVGRGGGEPGEPETIPVGDASDSLRENVDATVGVLVFAWTFAATFIAWAWLSWLASRPCRAAFPWVACPCPNPNPNPVRILASDAAGSRSFATVSPVSARQT